MKKYYGAILLAMLTLQQATAQDSPQKLWKIVDNTNEADTNRLKALQLICVQIYLYSKPDSAAFYADRLYRMAGEMHAPKFQSAALNILGASSSLRGYNKRAIAYLTRSLKIQEKLGDRKRISSCLNNIGVIYDEQEEFGKAAEYYIRAMVINEKSGDDRAKALSYTNVGNAYRSLKKYPQSVAYQQKAIAINQALKDEYSLGISLHSIGVTYFDMHDYAKALDYNLESIPYYEKSQNLQGLPEVFTILGRIYALNGDLEKAVYYNRRALDLAKQTEAAASIREADLDLYKNYKQLGKYKEALDMYESFILMRDKIKNEESQQELIRQELSYRFEKQQALNKKEREKQQVVIVSGAVGLLLVLMFVFIVIKRLQVTRRQKAEIERQKDLVEEKQKEILDSITYAKRLQDAILPPQEVVSELFPESFVLYWPKDIVAGDFYWMERTHDTILLAVADCTGHGVPGAMVSVVCSTALNRAVMEFGLKDPGKILDKVREMVLETFAKSDKNVKDGMDISLMAFNPKTLELQWAGANNPLWYMSDNELKCITADKQPIGVSTNPTPFTTHSLQLQKGESIYLFSDGYADQFGGEKGKKFKYKPLKDLLIANTGRSMTAQRDVLESTFIDWKNGYEQVDDVCMIGVRV